MNTAKLAIFLEDPNGLWKIFEDLTKYNMIEIDQILLTIPA
jgi:hypothetical protein